MSERTVEFLKFTEKKSGLFILLKEKFNEATYNTYCFYCNYVGY